jgi:PKHD-type hydroxylase
MIVIPALPRRNPGVGGIRFQPLLSNEECDRIVASADARAWQEGGVGGYGTQSAVVRQVRSVLEQRLPIERDGFPLAAILGDICRINSELWGFDLNGFVADDMPSLMRYRGNRGDHNDWHMDMGRGVSASRKLGFTLQLSSGDQYDGGDLEFHNIETRGGDLRQKGTLIVFPTYWLHRVAPLKSGIRHVVVGWVHGPSFH